MELQLSYLFSILFAFPLFVFMVLKILKREKTTSSTSKLPPGPWRLPILGNLHQLSTLPHHSLRDLANKHGPFMYLRLGEVPTLVVSSPEFAKEVMKTHDIIFASRPQILASEIMTYGSANIAFAPYGEYWRQLRRVCAQELLSSARVQSFKPVREEELSNLIKWIASNVGSAINITERIYWSTFSITSRTAFGKKRKDQEKFIKILKECEEAAAGFEPADVFPSFKFLHLLSGTRL